MREWTTVDKADWGPGPWQDEPDKVHWVDPVTDLDCLMNRGPSGAWCGYVAVAEGHPFFEVGYSECTRRTCESYCQHRIEVDVHGGLTYAAFCEETSDESKGICHVPLPGRPHRVWWFGFDCAHLRDRTPGRETRDRARGWDSLTEPDARYRDRAYVQQEVESLARQLAAAVPIPSTVTESPEGHDERER